VDGLGRIFRELVVAVPEGPVGEAEFIFEKRVLPVPPRTLSSERIVLRKSHHDYNGWYRADLLLLFMEPDSSRELGLFLLACAFHEPETAALTLPTFSDVRQIIYRRRSYGGHSVPVGLHQSPSTFRYFPERVMKHPWSRHTDVNSLPLLALSSLDESSASAEDWEARDTVYIASSAEGTVRLAELLLNAGCSWNLVRDFELEGDAGFRGVAPLSAELRIVLPGSLLWLARPNQSDTGA
jgi:hypothetical protein